MFLTKYYILSCLHGNMIIFTFLHLLYHEDNNVSHQASSNKNQKKKEQLLSYMFSSRGRKLNDQKQDFTEVFQISNTLF